MVVDDMLNKLQKEKYFCTTFLNEIGEKGQAKLLASKVLVIGAGGLASSTLLYLASSGVGTIGVVDFDKVSLDNLPRQILYGEKDVGKFKVDAVKEKLESLNSDIKVIIHKTKLDKQNAKELFKGYDIVLDCVDNFETKFIINDACKELSIPLVTAGVSGYAGQVMVVTSKSKHDFKSIFSTLPLNISKEDKDADRGVFPLAVATVSNIQCNEALKLLLDIGDHLIDKMLVIDTLNNKFNTFKLK